MQAAIDLGLIEVGAEYGEHAFGVIARAFRLDQNGLALGFQAREQHGRFHLRRRDGRTISNPLQLAAMHIERHAVILGVEARPHLAERGDDAVHRPLAQRLIAVEARAQSVATGRPQQQPRGGARVAAIDHASRLAELPGPLDHPAALIVALNARAKGAHGIGRGHHVRRFEQPPNLGFAFREGAQN